MKYTSEELREIVSNALGGEWREGNSDDGRMYRAYDRNQDTVFVSIDIREFLVAEFGGRLDSWVLHWDAYNWRYAVESL